MPTAVVFVESDDDPTWEHAVYAAVMKQGGSFEPLDAASRSKLINAIREDFPEAVLEFSPPADESLPRLVVRPRPSR